MEWPVALHGHGVDQLGLTLGLALLQNPLHQGVIADVETLHICRGERLFKIGILVAECRDGGGAAQKFCL